MKCPRKIATELETIHNIPSMFSHKDNLSISCTYSFDFMNHFLKFKKKKPPTACEDSFKETGLIQTIRDVVEQRYRMNSREKQFIRELKELFADNPAQRPI